MNKVCIRCGERIGRNSTKYCSLKCQHLYQWEQKKKVYEKTGVIKCNTSNLKNARRYLLEEHGNKCAICGITEWRGKPVPLVCDHINGDPYDHRIVNLRLVCANCDAQLPTYKSKNWGNGRKSRRS